MAIVACPLMDQCERKSTNRDYQGGLKICKWALEMYSYCNPDTPADRLREIVPDIEAPSLESEIAKVISYSQDDPSMLMTI